MKRQKPHNRIPWWCFEIPYQKPPTKGWWKIWQRRKERRYGKEQAKKGGGRMLKKLYECLIYTLIRGYIHKGYCYYQPYITDTKRGLDEYNKCWLYKILKHIV